MKKLLTFVLSTFLILNSLTACAPKSSQDIVSKALDLDVSGGSEISYLDTHSGNGDGISCIVLGFQDDALLEQIKENDDWSSLPLDQTTQALVYGISGETDQTSYQIGPYLSDNEGNSLVPEVENGYYFLLDRQAEEGQATGADILNRGSFNFTFGLYDTDTNTLYFCELDT